MALTDEQKSVVAGWITDGDSLSDVQKKLSSEMGVSMTYMDVRFLVLDLGVELQDPEEPVAVSEDADGEAAAPVGEQAAMPGAPAGVAGGVAVEVDRLMKPGALVSGSVTFTDGTAASWMLDQMGRLSLDAGVPDYAPSEDDLLAFQEALKEELKKKGF